MNENRQSTEVYPKTEMNSDVTVNRGMLQKTVVGFHVGSMQGEPTVKRGLLQETVIGFPVGL